MKIIGIDISSDPKRTSVCVIDTVRKVIEPPISNCDDECLRKFVESAQVIGIDAPFGWPQGFRNAVTRNAVTESEWEDRQKLRLRCTDERLKTRLSEDGKKGSPTPLSMSADKIAVTAWQVMALCKFGGDSDRSGTESDVNGKRFIEVYPAASLHVWDIARTSGKGSYKSLEAKNLREKMLDKIGDSLKQFIPPTYADSDHNLDALIAALTAYAAHTKQTHRPEQSEMIYAKVEGWIHLPAKSLWELGLFKNEASPTEN